MAVRRPSLLLRSIEVAISSCSTSRPARSGGSRRRLEVFGNAFTELTIAPTGRTVAFKQYFGEHVTEVWTLDLPMAPAQVRAAARSVEPQTLGDPDRVNWSIATAPNARVAAGRTFYAVVSAKIEPGWHLYALSQPAGGPIAMSITVPKGQPFSLAARSWNRRRQDAAIRTSGLTHSPSMAPRHSPCLCGSRRARRRVRTRCPSRSSFRSAATACVCRQRPWN